MDEIKHKTKKNQEKRMAVLRNYKLINKEINDQSYNAFNTSILESENRVKTNFEDQNHFSQIQYKNFKEYNNQKEERLHLMKSLD